MKCVYCNQSEPAVSFNKKEHVVPKSFSSGFQNNLTLDCVCNSCNEFFDKELDLPLARNSTEGVMRFPAGIKKGSEYKTLGKRNTTETRIHEGPWKDMIAIPSPREDQGQFVNEPLPRQIGIRKPGESDFEWFSVDHLPNAKAWAKTKETDEAEVQLIGFENQEEGLRILNEKGFPLSNAEITTDDSLVTPKPVVVRMETTSSITHTTMRGIAKIFFNYIAYSKVVFCKSAQLSEFRDYVRYGTHKDKRFVRPIMGPALRINDQTVQAHLCVWRMTDGGDIVGLVTLGNFLFYWVQCPKAAPHVQVPRNHRYGHVWNYSDKTVYPMPPELIHLLVG